MKRLSITGRINFFVFIAFIIFPAMTSFSASAAECNSQLTKQIPARASRALVGSVVMDRLLHLSGSERDQVVAEQVLDGNIPAFLRKLTPVTFEGELSDGQNAQVTICVTPDYLAIGHDRDFVRVPMGLPAAARIAVRFGFFLPTTKMVDAIYSQAAVHLEPSPMSPTNQMTSTSYLMQHNSTVDTMRARSGRSLDALTAGQKKDLVFSMRLRAAPGKVAIYGWHRTNGIPIQPLSTVHGARYADYSHGVRLVSQTAFVNGNAQSLTSIMQNPELAQIVSEEGPIANAQDLLVSLSN